METEIINLYGGPGSGKSTTAAGLFHILKSQGRNVELVTEYAKDIVWQESFKVLDNQLYIFAKQHHRLWRVNGKVEYIITDSPLLFSCIYDEEKDEDFKRFVFNRFEKFNNINIFLKRTKDYNPVGRMQTEEAAKNIDKTIFDFLYNNNVPFEITNGNKMAVIDILNYLNKYDENI